MLVYKLAASHSAILYYIIVGMETRIFCLSEKKKKERKKFYYHLRELEIYLFYLLHVRLDINF